MNKKLLAILIPTYNRKTHLLNNLRILTNYIHEVGCEAKTRIVVSDNCSLDGTSSAAKAFLEGAAGDFVLLEQESNLGAERNCVACLERSQAEYSMFLGDDDYLDVNYFKRVLSYLDHFDDVSCILPNFYAVDNSLNQVGAVRDAVMADQIYTPEHNRLDLMFKAHQLSGVVFKTEGTLDSYLKQDARNMYPFMYFVAFNIRRGRTIHVTEFPVKVTVTNSKDWNYGKDGLITEVMKNIAVLDVSEKERFNLEKFFLRTNKFRYLQYTNSPFEFLKVVFSSDWYSFRLRWYIVWRVCVDAVVIPVIRKLFAHIGYDVKRWHLVRRKDML